MRIPHICVGLLALVVLGGCVATGGVEDLVPGERPDLDTDEAGIWMLADRWEGHLRSSGRILPDPAINDYVYEVACRVAGEYCRDLRIYVVEVPYFNAFVMSNGAVSVWTGLLLRVEDEAQLAAVLGHEVAHYERRHLLTYWRDLRNKAALYTWGQIALYGAGVPGAPLIDLAGQLALIGSVFRFSREHEREADELGLRMMASAGYDPTQAARIWEALIEERDAEDESTPPPIFLSTHPHPEERAAKLKRLAAGLRAEGGGGSLGRDRYVEELLALRATLLESELTQHRFASTQLILERLRGTNRRPGEVEFFQGELYRLRDEEGDAERARDQYRRALTLDGVPDEAYRSLGLVLRRLGDAAGAREALGHYLELAPDAEDRAMIEAYLAAKP